MYHVNNSVSAKLKKNIIENITKKISIKLNTIFLFINILL